MRILKNVSSASKGIVLVDQKNFIVDHNEVFQKFNHNKKAIGKNFLEVKDNLSKDIVAEEFGLNTKKYKCYVLSEISNDLENVNLDLECKSEKLEKILSESYDELFVIDKNGIIIYVNEACERNYGLKPSEMIGKTVFYFLEEGYYDPPIIDIVFKEKRRVTVEQKTILGKKLVVTATPILNDAGEVELVVMNSRDITEIERLKINLEETKKLVEKYKQEVEELRKKENRPNNLIFKSKNMKEFIELIQRVASSDATLLMLGESGTGKSFISKYIHSISNRKEGPFKTINCAALPEQLLESELFGYKKGAFTGANSGGKIGLLELADGGTLFLDEIGEIPLQFQAKLLEVIQENRFIPIGGTEYRKIDVRIIAATNRDLEKMVREGKFREDLYYRLNVIELEIPPLRERADDIVPLAHFFLNKFDKKYKTSHYFSQDCLDVLISYNWPGNVRELQHTIERLVITVQGSKILPEHLPKNFQKNKNIESVISLSEIVPLDILEREMIIKAYKKLGSSYKVAKALNISQSKANRKIREYLS